MTMTEHRDALDVALAGLYGAETVDRARDAYELVLDRLWGSGEDSGDQGDSTVVPMLRRHRRPPPRTAKHWRDLDRDGRELWINAYLRNE